MFILIILISLMLIYLCIFITVNLCKKNIQLKLSQKEEHCDYSKQMMGLVQTNNTYPKLLDIFTHLEDSVAQHKMKLNTNFEGYFKNEQ